MRSPLYLPTVLLIAGGIGYYSTDTNDVAVGAVGANCNIKGNISINSGERIYHVPGQKFYDETVIRPEYGERWFCTESEARAAGWRKARR